MTEQEFLEKRIPFWLEGDNLNIVVPSNLDKKDVHSHLCKKYGYGWLFTIRGYYWPGSHVQLYCGNYETPNVTTLVTSYLFNYFTDIKYIRLGCHIGNVGELWSPKIIVVRDMNILKDEIRSL